MSEVWEPTVEEWIAARDRLLADLGCTFDELKAMHDSGHYETPEHFKAWIAVGE